MSSKNAMSAIDPAFTSGALLFAIVVYFASFLTPEKIIAPIATAAKM